MKSEAAIVGTIPSVDEELNQKDNMLKNIIFTKTTTILTTMNSKTTAYRL